jgi:hypothetical protein
MSEQKSDKPGEPDRFENVTPDEGLIVEKDRIILDDSATEELEPEKGQPDDGDGNADS